MKLLFRPHTLTFAFEIPSMLGSAGVQKILGMAIGLKHHRVDYFPYWHRSNSILLGASAAKDNGIVKLWNYSYVDGVRIESSMGTFEPNTKLDVCLVWGIKTINILIYQNNIIKGTATYNKKGFADFSMSKIGYILYPYFETDAPENKRQPFNVRIWDVKVNGKYIKLKR